MAFEKRVLDVVATVTDTPAYFFNGTLFLESNDSYLAVKVFNTLRENVTAALAFCKSGEFETSYDFLA
jgi:hypothetical protein